MKRYFYLVLLSLSFFLFAFTAFAEDLSVEFTVDVASATIPLPGVFKPNIDLSGRGFHQETAWPQEIAAKEVLDNWQKEIGFSGLYRIQYNLWDISQLAKEKELQDKLLAQYEAIIKNINDSGGTVILDLFSTPPGLGKALDKKSPPWDLKAFKEVVKNHIRELSCKKRYNIWYEVWSAPDLDAFFLGSGQEYLGVYRAVAEAIKELEQETKLDIPVGGPSTSWWFQNLDGNTILAPEKSLIYDLIKFCARYKLPLDFISWHAYSTDPQAEREATIYNKISVALIRDWLSYFKLKRDIPLIVSEWNYDNGSNSSPERKEKSFVSASYIPSRLKNMYKAGLDYQLFFALEDFQGNQEGIIRNVGIFWFEENPLEYSGGNKASFNTFRMLKRLGNSMLTPSSKPNDEFIDIIATRKRNELVLVLYNYIDPDIFMNYITRNVSSLSNSERKGLLNLLKTDTLRKIMNKETALSGLRLHKRVKLMLSRAQELNERATKFMYSTRTVKLNIKNILSIQAGQQAKAKPEAAENEKGYYIYQKYSIDSSCSINCDFSPLEERDIDIQVPLQETVTLNPYSVTMIVIKKKPKVAEITFSAESNIPAVTAAPEVSSVTADSTPTLTGQVTTQEEGNTKELQPKEPK